MPPGHTGTICDACASGLPGVCTRVRAALDLPSGDPARQQLLQDGPRDLIAAQRWDDLEAMLTDLFFLEAKAEAGLVFELADDFAAALQHLPSDRPVRRILELLNEALRRDLHFIATHPSAFFQCLWNSGWWYDCLQAEEFYEPPFKGWPPEGPPWSRQPRLALLLESWRRLKEERDPGFTWLCSLRPPAFPLGGPQRTVIPFESDQMRIVNLAFTMDGTLLLGWLKPVDKSAREDEQLRVWNVVSGREVHDLDNLHLTGNNRARSPDGRWQAQFGGPHGGWGQPVRLLDAEGRKVATLPTGEDFNIWQVNFSADGRRLIGGGLDDEHGGVVFIWDVPSGQQIARMRPPDSVFAVAHSSDGRLAAAGTSFGEVLIWDLEAHTGSIALLGHECALQALAFAADGRVASASHDGTVRIWDPSRITPLPRLRKHPGSIIDMTFSTDGRRLITVSSNCTTWIWDGEHGTPVACPYRSNSFFLEGGPPRNGVYADSQRIISLAQGQIWDAATGELLQASRDEYGRTYFNSTIVWAPDGERFAILGSLHRRLGIGTTEHLYEPLWLKEHEAEVNDAAFSPDGRRLVSGADDGAVCVWDAVTGNVLATLRGHKGSVACVDFSPDGSRVISGAADRTVRIWDWAGGVELACLRIDDAGVWRTSYHRDGGQKETHAVLAVAFAKDGRHVLTLSSPGRIRIWDPATGACVRTIQGHGGLQAVVDGSPWLAFLRGEMLEVEAAETGTVIARTPLPCSLIGRIGPRPRPDGRAWAVALAHHLYFYVLVGGTRSAVESSGNPSEP